MAPSVAFVIDELEIGGTQRQVHLMAKGLAARGWRVQVVCLQPVLTMASDFNATGIPVFGMFKRQRIDLRLLWRLCRHLRAQRFEVVHAFSSTAEFYGGLAARAAGCRFIGSVRSSSDPLPIAHRWAKRAAAGLAHAVIANTCAGRDDAISRRLAPVRKIHVVPNGVESKTFHTVEGEQADARLALGLPVGAPVVVSVGRLVRPKGWGTIVDIAYRVVRTHPTTVFVIVGDGPLRGEIDRQVHALELDDRVLRLGERSDVKRVLAAGDIYLHASQWEGMSNAIMEAMAMGRPVVASAVGGTPELVHDCETGFLFPVGEISTAVERVNHLIADPNLRSTLGNRGRLVIEAGFSADATVSRLEDLYESLLGSRSGRTGSKR